MRRLDLFIVVISCFALACSSGADKSKTLTSDVLSTTLESTVQNDTIINPDSLARLLKNNSIFKSLNKNYLKALDDDPRSYAHTHTTLLTSHPSNPTQITSGILAVVEADEGTNPEMHTTAHTVSYYLPFINTKGVSDERLRKVMLNQTNHGHTLRYKEATIDVLDANGKPTGTKILIAYDLTVQ